MIQNVLRALGGIEIYGILSVCLFFAVFLVALVFAITRKKPFCQTMSALPLDDDHQKKGASTYEE
jgi:hypothetical protein